MSDLHTLQIDRFRMAHPRRREAKNPFGERNCKNLFGRRLSKTAHTAEGIDIRVETHFAEIESVEDCRFCQPGRLAGGSRPPLNHKSCPRDAGATKIARPEFLSFIENESLMTFAKPDDAPGPAQENSGKRMEDCYQELYGVFSNGEVALEDEWTSVRPADVCSALNSTSSKSRCQSLFRVMGSIGTAPIYLA